MDALDIAVKETLIISTAPVTIFCDFQEDLRVIEHPLLHKRNRFLKVSIYKKTKRLECNRYYITIQWFLSHLGIVGNEKADQVEKNKAKSRRHQAKHIYL